jgi:hypothetical protein
MLLKISLVYLAILNKPSSDKISIKSCQNPCKNNMISFSNPGDKKHHGKTSINQDLYLLWLENIPVSNLPSISESYKNANQLI